MKKKNEYSLIVSGEAIHALDHLQIKKEDNRST